MTRDAGTIRERIFQALIQRYKADGEDALVKIDALIRGDVVPDHNDVTGDIDKLLAKVADAEEKMATLRRHLWHKLGVSMSKIRHNVLHIVLKLMKKVL